MVANSSPLKFVCYCGTNVKEVDQTVVVIESRQWGNDHTVINPPLMHLYLWKFLPSIRMTIQQFKRHWSFCSNFLTYSYLLFAITAGNHEVITLIIKFNFSPQKIGAIFLKISAQAAQTKIYKNKAWLLSSRQDGGGTDRGQATKNWGTQNVKK